MANLFPMFRTGGMVAAEQELNDQMKARYGNNVQLVSNAADQPGDVLPKQAVLEDSMRKNGGVGWLEGLTAGAQRTLQVANGTLDRNIGRLGADQGMSDEQLRKYSQSVHNLAPVADTLGMLGGAGLGAVGAGLGWAKNALLSGSKYIPAAVLGEAGTEVPMIARAAQTLPSYAERGLNYLASGGGGLGKLAAAYPLGMGSVATIGAIGGGFGMNATGLGEYGKMRGGDWVSPDGIINPAAYDPKNVDLFKARVDSGHFQKVSDDPVEQAKYVATQKIRDQLALGTLTATLNADDQRPSAVDFRTIYNNSGQPQEGVTPALEQAIRARAAYEAKGLAGQTADRRRDASYYDPALFAEPRAAAATLKIAGGRTVNGMPALADAVNAGLVDPVAAAIAARANLQTAPTLAAAVDNSAPARPKRSYQERVWMAEGKQAGVTDPDDAILLGQAGTYTPEYMRTRAPLAPQRVPAKDALIDQMEQEFQDRATQIEANTKATEQEKDAALLALITERNKMRLSILAPSTVVPDYTQSDGQTAP